MMDELKLSIIIPAYNSEKFIGKCLMSCLEQDIPLDEYEIIVVDDGSTDRTKETVLTMGEKYGNIRYVYQENAAQGAARNNGLGKARGKYIWFVDSDDRIEKNCLGEITEKLEQKKLTAVLVGHATEYETELERWEELDDSRICPGKELIAKGKFYISPTYGVWRRDYLEEYNIRFLERIFHEDSEICPRMYYKAQRIGFISRICYFVFPNLNSTTRKVNPKRAFDLIAVVDNLSRFNDGVEEKDVRESLYNYISLMINSSLYNIYSIPENDRKLLGKAWYENRKLLDNLKMSDRKKYRIEGILFGLFPKNVCTVYRMMQMLNPNPGNMNRQNKLLGR